jgi:hypothetical protein
MVFIILDLICMLSSTMRIIHEMHDENLNFEEAIQKYQRIESSHTTVLKN